MKRVTASQARRNWFRLLDEVVAGEVVVIERKGRRIVLKREEEATGKGSPPLPDYSSLLEAPNAERADRWDWSWESESGDLSPVEAPARERPPADAPEDAGNGKDEGGS